MAKSELKLVGYLQYVDKPYVSLYYNTKEQYMLVRVLYVCATAIESRVSGRNVLNYISGICGICDLLGNNQIPNNSMFIEELCHEKCRIEKFCLTHLK